MRSTAPAPGTAPGSLWRVPVEINLVVNALREGVATDLQIAPASVPSKLLIARLSKRLQDHLAVNEQAARWAVESWALALGKISRSELGSAPITPSKLEMAAPPREMEILSLIRHKCDPAGSAIALIYAISAGIGSTVGGYHYPDNAGYCRCVRMASWDQSIRRKAPNNIFTTTGLFRGAAKVINSFFNTCRLYINRATLSNISARSTPPTDCARWL